MTEAQKPESFDNRLIDGCIDKSLKFLRFVDRIMRIVPERTVDRLTRIDSPSKLKPKQG